MALVVAKALFSFSFYVCLVLSSASAGLDHHHHGRGGFSVELIHRDSPKSPLYDPSETPSHRIANAIRRSISRAATRFSSRVIITSSSSSSVGPSGSSGSVQSTLYTNRGEYLMSLSIGTPPFPILAIADTGSDLTWTQCQPCSSRCYNQTAPLFNPGSSSTYKNAPCQSTLCQSATGAKISCSSGDTSCHYLITYGDQSYTRGNLATDTVTLSSTTGRPISFPGIVIGCGHDNAGTFDEKGSGIVGLGGASDSLVSQLDSSIGGKFSYCLVPFTSVDQPRNSSKLNFGSNAVVSGGGVVSTPFVLSGQYNTFYSLTLEGISVTAAGSSANTTFIKFRGTGYSSSDQTDQGNIIIDSGTTLTMVPEELYSDLEAAVAKEVGKSANRVDDPSGALSLCYSIGSGSVGDHLKIPVVTFHFRGGADVKLNGINTFVVVSEGVACFSIVPVEGLAIFGNLAQMNFLIGYDRQKNTLSFKPTDCTKF
ncbi:Aspartic peptidase [Trema orientale]|uniref:Aspartic peptidase n=1 Tax=Trema orientale TaxID=63057 RepID=A0A2P5EPJ2_TREOI|nr:Aspartic peptidase [Trema orientale]